MADQNKDPQKNETHPAAPPTDPLAPVGVQAKKAAPRKLDETIPGGRYLSDNGTFVDANGVPLKDQGKKEEK